MSMANQKIRIGIVGLGRMSMAYRYALQPLADWAEITAVCDNVPDKIEAWQAKSSVKKSYLDYHELCADPDIDVVLITVPHAADPQVEDPHYDVSKAALENKKHALVEKPMAVTGANAYELVALAKKNGVKFTTAENTRFVPGYMEADRLVKEGVLGDILFVRTFVDGSAIEELQEGVNWLCKEPNGGVILDMGVHSFYLLKWIFGGVKDITAFSHKIMPEAALEDNGVFTGGLVNGTYYYATVSTIAKVPWTERLEVYGTLGSVIVDHLVDPTVVLCTGPDDKLERKPVESVPYEPKMWKWKSMLMEVSDFLEAVRDDREPGISAEDGAYAVQVAEAAYKSVRQGTAVLVG
jgi:predicted dehydrogenase